MRRTRRDYALTRGPEIYLHKARVARARAAGVDVIDLGFADVHLEPPEEVNSAIAAYVDKNPSVYHYGDVAGIMPLREAVASYLSETGEAVSSEQIIITAGANYGTLLALLATTRPNDQIVIPAPFFFNHATQVQLAGCQPALLMTHGEDRYRISPSAWESYIGRIGVGAAILTDPRNPTTTYFEGDDLSLFLEAAELKRRFVLVDESYREFAPKVAKTMVKYGKTSIRIGSLSKSFCLAGWRVGYMVVPEAIYADVIDAQDALLIHPTIASQQMALLALEARAKANYVVLVAQEVARRRIKAAEQVTRLSWVAEVFSDAGTFIWVKLVPPRKADLCAERLLTECGVGVLPGSAFGPGGDAFLRIGIGCVDLEMLDKALQRLSGWGG